MFSRPLSVVVGNKRVAINESAIPDSSPVLLRQDAMDSGAGAGAGSADPGIAARPRTGVDLLLENGDFEHESWTDTEAADLSRDAVAASRRSAGRGHEGKRDRSRSRSPPPSSAASLARHARASVVDGVAGGAVDPIGHQMGLDPEPADLAAGAADAGFDAAVGGLGAPPAAGAGAGAAGPLDDPWAVDGPHGKLLRSAFITLQTPTPADLAAVKKFPYAWVCVGEHVGRKTHRLHWHIAVQFRNQVTFTRVKKALPRANIKTPMKGSADDCRGYLNKDNKILFEDGVACQQGGRMGLLVQAIKAGRTIPELLEEFPEEVLKFHGGVEFAIRALQSPTFNPPVHPLYPWQAKLERIALSAPDERTIWSIVDLVGNTGKSWFCKYMHKTHGAMILENGKTADIAHAYGGERIVMIDLAKAVEGVNYQIIEALKNGVLFSGKYDSRTKYYDCPHVFLFSNWELDASRFTRDKLKVIRLHRLIGAPLPGHENLRPLLPLPPAAGAAAAPPADVVEDDEDFAI